MKLARKAEMPYSHRMIILTITAKGQVTLRREVLAHLGVGPGDRVLVETRSDGRVMLAAAPRRSITEVFGLLEGKGTLGVDSGERSLSIADIDRITAESWAGRG